MLFQFFTVIGILDAVPASGNGKNCRADKSIHSAAIDTTCDNFNMRDMITVRFSKKRTVIYLLLFIF